MDDLIKDIADMLSGRSIKHELHRFPSGAVMLDIWHREQFFVLQFYNNEMGFSEITKENPGFDTIPDLVFQDAEKFMQKLETALS